MAVNVTGWLTDRQLELLRVHGAERTADVGDVLYRVGDRTYPFIATLEGEAAILDGRGEEIVRHGPHGFLGELNLFSGQTVYVTAVATERMRYIAVDREAFRRLLFDDEALGDVVTSVTQARKFGARLASPYRAVSLEPDLRNGDRHVMRLGAMVVRFVHERMPAVPA